MSNLLQKYFGKPAIAGFLLILFLFKTDIYSQEGWYFTSSVQLSGGKYILDSYSRVLSVYGGLRYQGDNFGISASIPVVINSQNSSSQIGGVYLPVGTNSGSMQNRMNANLGDLYGYFDYKIISSYEYGIDCYLNAQVKLPVSGANTQIGTGEIDYGGSVTVRKSLNDFVGFIDIGYLNIGDPSSITYKNPLTYGVGFGKFFGYGEYSVLLYYAGYTKVLDDYDAPKQFSLGLNYRASETIIFSLISSLGIGNMSPEFTLSGGVRIKL